MDWKVSKDLLDIKVSTKNIERKLDDAKQTQQSKEFQAILSWLTEVDHASQHSDHLRRREKGTGKWLLNSTKFHRWLTSDRQTLFCPGKPGSGKTMIACIVIDCLQARFHNDANIGITYLYCKFNRQDEQTPEILCTSLLKQLLRKQTIIHEAVRKLHGKHMKEGTRPQMEEIIDALRLVMASFSKTFIVIDALDECGLSINNRRAFLSDIFRFQAQVGANVFATSRFFPDIMERFKQSPSLPIHAQDEDVELFLERNMDQLPLFVWHDVHLQQDIKSTIIGTVDGM